MNADLQRIGKVLASHVAMLKGFLGEQFAVTIVARHTKGPMHLLLGDDTELTLMGVLSELQRMGRSLIKDGVEEADPEPTAADHMINLLQECAEHLRGNTIQSSEVNAEIAGRIEQVLETVAPEQPPTTQPAPIPPPVEGVESHALAATGQQEQGERHVLDWCQGCESGSNQNLPEDWQQGDAVPAGTTVHDTPRERAAGQSPFAFRGDPMRGDRVLLITPPGDMADAPAVDGRPERPTDKPPGPADPPARPSPRVA